MLMMQTCSQARKDKVRNSVIYNPGIHFACASKQLIRLNVLFETNNISTMAMLKKKQAASKIVVEKLHGNGSAPMSVACSRLQGSRVHEIEKAHYLITSTSSLDHTFIFLCANNLRIIPAI